MKKILKYYIIGWIVLIAIFNVTCFVTPNEINGVSKYTGGFWVCYGLVTISYVLQLLFVRNALLEKDCNHQKQNIALIVISFIELFVIARVGTIFMMLPSLPSWIGIIVCGILMGISVLILLIAKIVGRTTDKANIKLNNATARFRKLQDETQILLAKTQSPEVKREVQKLCDAIRYSDPMSAAELEVEERVIEEKLEALFVAIENDVADIEMIDKVRELLILVETRNLKCKNMKRQRV